MIEFQSPYWFFALLLVFGALFKEIRRQRTIRLPFSETGMVTGSHSGAVNLFSYTGILFRALGLILVVIALARPQFVRGESKRVDEGLDIMVVIDTSESMKALDFEVNGKRVDRLSMIKKVVTNFIEKRPSDRIGFVVFGEEAFTQAPLTLDHEALLEFLDRLEIGMAGSSTAIGDGLATATKRLKDVQAKSKLVILLTDGENNAGSVNPLSAAQAAAAYDVKLYTVGIGKKGLVPVPMDGFFGKTIQQVEMKINEKELTKMAGMTGGKYFRAQTTGELVGIYETIDKLEKTKLEVKEYRHYEEWYKVFVWVFLIFLIVELVYNLTPFRPIP